MPFFETTVTQPTLAPIVSTPTLTDQVNLGENTPEAIVWNAYEDTELGFDFQYPSNWFISQPTNPPSSTVNYAVILSNALGNNSPQGRTEDETARMTISYAEDQTFPLEVWIAMNWTGLNAEIHPATVSNLQGWSYSKKIDDSLALYTISWVEHNDRYFILESYADQNGVDDVMVREILSTLVFHGE